MRSSRLLALASLVLAASLEGVYWTCCDLDGAGSNPNLSFDLTQLGVMTATP